METSAYTLYTNLGAPIIGPMPKRLHWGWVLVLSILTRGFFSEIWLLVQANWVDRLTGRSEARKWAIINLCAIPVLFLGAVLFGLVAGSQGFALTANRGPWIAMEAFVGIAIFALHVTATFKVRAALEEEPIGIPLGGVMTFFFGPVYFQYFLRDWMPMGYSAMSHPQYTSPTAPPLA